MKLIKSLFANKQLLVLLGVVLLGTALFVTSSYLSQREKVTQQASRAATANACELKINIAVICESKVDVALVLDRSSSMNDLESDGRTKLEWAKDAAKAFVDTIQKSGKTNIRLSISSFGAQGNDGAGALSPEYNSTLHINLSSDYSAVKNAINSIKYIKKGTCVQCGIRIGNQTNQTSPNLKAQILLSDGKANHIWNGTTSGAKTAAINEANTGRSKGIAYYVLGYGLKSTGAIDEATLLAIAGDAQNYLYKPDANQWATAFLSILSKLCTKPTQAPTKGPSLTPAPCKNCNYQVDLFWGPVINSFANKPDGKTGNRYSSPLNRLITSRSDTPVTGTKPVNPACTLVTPPAYSVISIPALSSDCEKPVERGLLTGSINTRNINPPNGFAIASVKNTSPTCKYTVGLASYKANFHLPEAQWIPAQNLYDSQTLTIQPNQIVTLLVKMPMLNDQAVCHRQPTPTTIPTPTKSPTISSVCKVIFNTPDKLYCAAQAGQILISGTVISLPTARATLQKAWYIVFPGDKATKTVYSYETVVPGQKFTVTAQWPGIRPEDKTVEVHAGANILDANGNPYPNCAAGIDWYASQGACPNIPLPPNGVTSIKSTTTKAGGRFGYNLAYTGGTPIASNPPTSFAVTANNLYGTVYTGWGGSAKFSPGTVVTYTAQQPPTGFCLSGTGSGSVMGKACRKATMTAKDKVNMEAIFKYSSCTTSNWEQTNCTYTLP